jgi:hypothetical protein
MDQGQVAEFDTVLNLFDKEDSIFRSLCNEANLQRADILRIRAENAEEKVYVAEKAVEAENAEASVQAPSAAETAVDSKPFN